MASSADSGERPPLHVSDVLNGLADTQGSGPLRGVPEEILQRAAATGWTAATGAAAGPDGKKELRLELRPPETVVAVDPSPTTQQRNFVLDVELLSVVSCFSFMVFTYFVNLIVDDLRDDGRVSILHWDLLADYAVPRTVALAMALLLGVASTPVATYYVMRLWEAGRFLLCHKSLHNGRLVRLWDYGFALVGLAIFVLIWCLPTWAYWSWGFPVGWRAAITLTQAVMSLKMYSFLYEAVQEALSPAPQPIEASIGRLVYFLFTPTLVYMHEYERTPQVRPGVVLRYTSLMMLGGFTMVVVTSRSTIRSLCGGSDEPLMTLDGLQGVARLVVRFLVLVARFLPAAAASLPILTLIMHSSHRILAELLRFKPLHAFTRPWWNASSYVEWFRHWNPYVKAWIARYVYSEGSPERRMQQAAGGGGTGGNKLAKLAAMSVSAWAHEVLIITTLGYAVPFLALLYSLSGLIVLYDPLGIQKNRMVGNVFVLGGACLGVSIIVSFYFIETAARYSCPDIVAAPWNLILPHSLFCENPVANCTTAL